MTARFWADMRGSDFDDLDPSRTLAVLPTAAIAQHGPHLPLGTDALIMEGMLSTLMTACPEDLDVRVLPIQSIGKSNEHLWASGTLTLTAQTALSAWTEIGLSVARAGVRKIVLVNSHGGNLDLVSILSRELRVQADMLAVKCQWGSFGVPDGLYSEQERTHGIHGGDLETSLMLAFRPGTVNMDQARDFRSTAETSAIPPIGPVSYGWIASDLNSDGTVGEAYLATAEKGRATAEHQVGGFIQLLLDVAAEPVF